MESKVAEPTQHLQRKKTTWWQKDHLQGIGHPSMVVYISGLVYIMFLSTLPQIHQKAFKPLNLNY